jgi:hypothetical protein
MAYYTWTSRLANEIMLPPPNIPPLLELDLRDNLNRREVQTRPAEVAVQVKTNVLNISSPNDTIRVSSEIVLRH